MPEQWTLKEAAQVARVSRQTLQRAVQRGELPVFTEIGTGGVHYLCRDADLQEWVSRRLQRADEETLAPTDPAVHTALAEAVRELAVTRERLAAAEEEVRLLRREEGTPLSDRVATFVQRILGG